MGKYQFLIETGAYCFLCLRKSPSTHPNQCEDGDGGDVSHSSPQEGEGDNGIFSFRNIFQHLELNLGGVVMPSSHSQLSASTLEESELKGRLCGECAMLSERFSKRFLELEVIRMKLEESLKSLYKRMLEAEEGEGDSDEGGRLRLEEFREEMRRRPETLAQYGIVEQLRKETFERCSRRLSKGPPKVHLRRLGMEEIPQPHVKNFTFQDNNGGSRIKLESDNDDLGQGDDIGLEASSPSSLVRVTMAVASDPNFNNVPPGDVPNSEEEEARHKCQLCNATFKKKGGLRQHQRTVHFGQRFECRFCSKTFAQSSSRNLHLRRSRCPMRKGRSFGGASSTAKNRKGTRTGPQVPSKYRSLEVPTDEDSDSSPASVPCLVQIETYPADLATEDDSTGLNIGDHAEVKPEPVEIVECDICHIEVIDLPAHRYAVHFEVEDEEGQSAEGTSSAEVPDVPENPQAQNSLDPGTGKYKFKCELCQKQFRSPQGHKFHYDAIHLNIRFQCTCGKSFSDRASYNRHHQHAHLGITYNCEFCGKMFNFKGNLYQHQQSAHGGHTFRCQHCPSSFKHAAERSRHVRKSHPPNNDSFVNGSSEFSRGPGPSSSLPASAPVPTAPPPKGKFGPPRCTQCDRQFKTKKGLSRHLTFAHSTNHNQAGSEGKGKYECELCQKQFTGPNGLRLHTVAVHLGQRFPCSYCPQSFSQVSSRNLHMRKRCPKRPTE